jgi:hypothetical protein
MVSHGTWDCSEQDEQSPCRPPDGFIDQCGVREFCGTQCRFVVLGGAKCNGRHAASDCKYSDALLTFRSHNAEVVGSSPTLATKPLSSG